MKYSDRNKLGNVDSHTHDFDRSGSYDDYDTEDTEDTDETSDFEDFDVIDDIDEVEEFEEYEDEDYDDEDGDEDDDCDCDTSDSSSQGKPMISLPPDLVVRLLLLALAAVTGSQTVAWLHPAVEQMCDELDDLFHLIR